MPAPKNAADVRRLLREHPAGLSLRAMREALGDDRSLSGLYRTIKRMPDVAPAVHTTEVDGYGAVWVLRTTPAPAGAPPVKRCCVASYRLADGTHRRRYVLDDGRLQETIELPLTVVLSLAGKQTLARKLETWKRGEEQRARTTAMRKMIAQGVKPLAVAHSLGVCEQSVRKQRKKMQSNA